MASSLNSGIPTATRSNCAVTLIRSRREGHVDRLGCASGAPEPGGDRTWRGNVEAGGSSHYKEAGDDVAERRVAEPWRDGRGHCHCAAHAWPQGGNVS